MFVFLGRFGGYLIQEGIIQGGDVLTVSGRKWMMLITLTIPQHDLVTITTHCPFCLSLQVFFSVLIGAFALGQAFPNLEVLLTAAGASDTILEIINRVTPFPPRYWEGVNPVLFLSLLLYIEISA